MVMVTFETWPPRDPDEDGVLLKSLDVDTKMPQLLSDATGPSTIPFRVMVKALAGTLSCFTVKIKEFVEGVPTEK